MQTITSQMIFCDIPTTTLDKDALRDIELRNYPKNWLHYLAFALQNNTKLPSKCSMIRSERRNKRRIDMKATQKDKVNPHPGRIARTKRTFTIPNRFGPQPVVRVKRGRRGHGRGRGRTARVPINDLKSLFTKWQIKPLVPVYLKPLSEGPRPSELVRKERILKAHKSPSQSFRIRSFEELALKSQRTKFCSQIQKNRCLIEQESLPLNENKVVPLYFQKKKASQKRRRQEKHQLIKDNRKDLVRIFGDAIFKRGWPVSRKQIKIALGIPEKDPVAMESLGQFMEMAEESQKNTTSTGYKFEDEQADFPSLLRTASQSSSRTR